MKILNKNKILSKKLSRKEFSKLLMGYIYFFIRGNEIVYVGQTSDLYSRINTHGLKMK